MTVEMRTLAARGANVAIALCLLTPLNRGVGAPSTSQGLRHEDVAHTAHTAHRAVVTSRQGSGTMMWLLLALPQLNSYHQHVAEKGDGVAPPARLPHA